MLTPSAKCKEHLGDKIESSTNPKLYGKLPFGISSKTVRREPATEHNEEIYTAAESKENPQVDVVPDLFNQIKSPTEDLLSFKHGLSVETGFDPIVCKQLGVVSGHAVQRNKKIMLRPSKSSLQMLRMSREDLPHPTKLRSKKNTKQRELHRPDIHGHLAQLRRKQESLISGINSRLEATRQNFLHLTQSDSESLVPKIYLSEQFVPHERNESIDWNPYNTQSLGTSSGDGRISGQKARLKNSPHGHNELMSDQYYSPWLTASMAISPQKVPCTPHLAFGMHYPENGSKAPCAVFDQAAFWQSDEDEVMDLQNQGTELKNLDQDHQHGAYFQSGSFKSVWKERDKDPSLRQHLECSTEFPDSPEYAIPLYETEICSNESILGSAAAGTGAECCLWQSPDTTLDRTNEITRPEIPVHVKEQQGSRTTKCLYPLHHKSILNQRHYSSEPDKTEATLANKNSEEVVLSKARYTATKNPHEE